MDKKDNKKIDVMWIGLSHKKDKGGVNFLPLGEDTNSGKIVSKIEKRFSKLNFHRTNLVKFPPVDENNKLRYPTITEMINDFPILQNEILDLKPKIVFLLGSKVSNFVLEKRGLKLIKSEDTWQSYQNIKDKDIWFISIFHPSYVHVYKRRQIDDYSDIIYQIISDLLS